MILAETCSGIMKKLKKKNYKEKEGWRGSDERIYNILIN